MQSNESSYRSIFKSTFLFGFVQVFNIVMKAAINKAVAILLGTEGMGVISLYNSAVKMLRTVAGLGSPQSAVRDVAEANATCEIEKLNRIITVTKKIVWFTALLGAVVTIVFARVLSDVSFNNRDHIVAFIFLSMAVFLSIVSEGELAILKGMRRLRDLAKASVYGSSLGLLISVPLYYFWGFAGIVPSLILAAGFSALIAWLYVRKVNYVRLVMENRTVFTDGKGMIKMGLAFMYLSLFGMLSDFIIRAFISHQSGLDEVGIFQAGSTIVVAYFGIITTALTTDYYPRISAIHSDNQALVIEVNRQAEVGLLLMGPLVVLFMFAMPLFIRILYTEMFLQSMEYIQYAIFSILITIYSNTMGMILLAKQKSSIFVYTTTIMNVLSIVFNLVAYYYWGLTGLGISSIIVAVCHLLLMCGIMKKVYHIVFKTRAVKIFIFTCAFCLLSFFVKDLNHLFLRYGLGMVIFGCSFFYSLCLMRSVINLSLAGLLSKFWGRKPGK